MLWRSLLGLYSVNDEESLCADQCNVIRTDNASWCLASGCYKAVQYRPEGTCKRIAYAEVANWVEKRF